MNCKTVLGVHYALLLKNVWQCENNFGTVKATVFNTRHAKAWPSIIITFVRRCNITFCVTLKKVWMSAPPPIFHSSTISSYQVRAGNISLHKLHAEFQLFYFCCKFFRKDSESIWAKWIPKAKIPDRLTYEKKNNSRSSSQDGGTSTPFL